MKNLEEDKESPNKNTNKENQPNQILSPILKSQSKTIIETTPEINSKLYRERTLSPDLPKETINNMLQKMEMNNKNYPSKANFFKNDSNEKNNRYYSPRTNSPIVDYYAGINHTNYYSPDNDFSNFNNKNEEKFFQFQNMNNNLFMNNQYSNFNFSPSTIFNKDQRKLSNASINETLNNNNFNSNIHNIIGTSLQEKIEENLQKNSNQISINNEDDDNDDNQELYMLSFNSDEENNDENDNDSNDNVQYTLNIDDTDNPNNKNSKIENSNIKNNSK